MRFAIMFAAVLLTAPAWSASADYYSSTDLAKTADGEKAKAGAGGLSSTVLARYSNHHLMLAYKAKSGPAEIHTGYADVFVVEKGRATLLTEGHVDGAKEESPGELRGAAVTGGKETVLSAGDIVHIPAGVPHQLLVKPGEEFVYFVVKIKEGG